MKITKIRRSYDRTIDVLYDRSFSVIDPDVPYIIIREAIKGNSKPLQVFMAMNNIDTKEKIYMAVPSRVQKRPDFALAPYSKFTNKMWAYKPVLNSSELWLIKKDVFIDERMVELYKIEFI